MPREHAVLGGKTRSVHMNAQQDQFHKAPMRLSGHQISRAQTEINFIIINVWIGRLIDY